MKPFDLIAILFVGFVVYALTALAYGGIVAIGRIVELVRRIGARR